MPLEDLRRFFLTAGVDGDADLGAAMQEACSLQLPEHPLSTLWKQQQGRSVSSEPPQPERSDIDLSVSPAIAKKYAVPSEDLVSDPAAAVPGPQAAECLREERSPEPGSPGSSPSRPSPSPSAWTLSALIAHLHCSVLPALPPAATGLCGGPAHLVR